MTEAENQCGPWRIVFMGTPEFAGPCLSALAASGDEVSLVITQPDRPKGRGRVKASPHIKTLADELGLPVWQPESIKGPGVLERLRAIDPDLLVVVAFGQILPPSLLTAGRQGPPLNVHPSLLPCYRGPAPINWAILEGLSETGVTTMFLDQGMDTGPILMTRPVPIGEDETAGELHDRLAVVGAELLMETIAGLKGCAIAPMDQCEDDASCCRLLEKPDGRIDWCLPARDVANRIRGLDPWPGAYTTLNGVSVKLFGAYPGTGQGLPGQVLTLDQGRLHIAAGDGSVAVCELQLAGKRRLAAEDFWRGQRLDRDVFFGR